MTPELEKLSLENPLITLRDSFDITQNFHLLTGSYIYKDHPHSPPYDDVISRRFEEIFHSHQPVMGLDRIPKILHVIWIGPKEYPKESIPRLNNWLSLHPDWQLYLWTDRENLALPHPKAILKKAYVLDRLKPYYAQAINYGEMSDFIRFSILYDIGGVYVDHDIDCLKRIDSITRSCNFMACCDVPGGCASFIYLDHDTMKEHRSSFCIATSLVASIPKHPVWNHVFKCLEKDWDYFTNHKELSDYTRTLQRTFLPLTRGILQFNPQFHPSFALLPSLFHAPVNAIRSGQEFFNKVEGWIFALNYYSGAWIEEEKNTPS